MRKSPLKFAYLDELAFFRANSVVENLVSFSPPTNVNSYTVATVEAVPKVLN